MLTVAYGQKSHSRRKRSVRTPGGHTKIHYSRFKQGVSKCGVCGIPLNGIVSGSKSEKSVERPYGGYLCHNCLESLIKLIVRT